MSVERVRTHGEGVEQPESVKPVLRSPRYNSSQSSESHRALLTSGLVTMALGDITLLASSVGSMPILVLNSPRPNLSRARAPRYQMKATQLAWRQTGLTEAVRHHGQSSAEHRGPPRGTSKER